MISKITYEDKVSTSIDPSVPAINKIRDVDMNEIKSVVNNNADEFTNTVGDLEEILHTLNVGSGVE